MQHPDRRLVRSIDSPDRFRGFTEIVYGGEGDTHGKMKRLGEEKNRFTPAPPEYGLYVGELHGHTNLSDGGVDIDSYFKIIRDRAGLDFAAITDHTHGGVGNAELWTGSPSKWDIIRDKVREYYEPGKFTTILAYEDDANPFCDNMIVYLDNHHGDIDRREHDGEITSAEMRHLLDRNDVIVSAHDTEELSFSTDFGTLPLEFMPHFIEVLSRGDAAEYFGNPLHGGTSCCEGGFWQDALKRGAKIGCLGGSDDHGGTNGLKIDCPYPGCFPAVTGVWAEENTLSGIFSALKARRCYAFMGGKLSIDFRINGHYMGEEYDEAPGTDRIIYFRIDTDVAFKQVTVVKNCRDYVRVFGKNCREQLFFDYRQETPCDYYYLRVELEDGRFGWTSPIWINVR